MNKDGNLRPLFRRNLREFFWLSVETATEPGVPDSYYCVNGVSGWIEFKHASGNRIASLTPQQVAWHARLARKGGRSFFAVRRGRLLVLVPGALGSELRKSGISITIASPSANQWESPWPWEAIGNFLIS